MMSPAAPVNPSTTLSTVSSVGANNIENNTAPMTTTTTTTTTTVQSGPYTRAQFQNTIEGSRSVKNPTEIEQLLRDYPAALELYRTGRYKVKIKNEADLERVILVEKRSSKLTSSNQTVSEVSSQVEKKRDDSKKEKTRSRTHSRDAVNQKPSIPDKNSLVQTTTSSMRTLTNANPKVDHYRTPSKDRNNSVTSHTNQEQQQQQQQQQESNRRSNSRDSRSKVSQSQYKGKTHSRDYKNTLVPYVPNANPAANMWHQSRALQPYYSQPLLQQHPPPLPLPPQPSSSVYIPQPYAVPPNPVYQQPYYYGQQAYPPLTYQKPPIYPPTRSITSNGTTTNQSEQPFIPSYPSTAPPPQYNPNPGVQFAHVFQTFIPNQQQYAQPPTIYQSQVPYQAPVGWPNATNAPAAPVVNTTTRADSRRNSKTRTLNIDNGLRTHPPVGYHNVQPPVGPPTEHYHHHHRHHHHHRPAPTQVQDASTSTPAENEKDQNVIAREPAPIPPITSNSPEKLTIRQLNQIFLQTDASGRLGYSAVPNILQRFGITLNENDLLSAAQNLEYNTVEPLSARRLVHILVKLGKISRSTQHQQQQSQRPVASPTLPEDREVNDIMTQRRAAGGTSTHIHSSIYPNHWY